MLAVFAVLYGGGALWERRQARIAEFNRVFDDLNFARPEIAEA